MRLRGAAAQARASRTCWCLMYVERSVAGGPAVRAHFLLLRPSPPPPSLPPAIRATLLAYAGPNPKPYKSPD